MTTLNFGASVKGWTERAKRNVTLVLRESAQELFFQAQRPVAQGGNMPVDTGFLRNSLSMNLRGSTSASGADGYVLTIAQMDAGDVLEGVWTASYARYVEYGARGRQPRYFVRSAAVNWQGIVAASAAKFKD